LQKNLQTDAESCGVCGTKCALLVKNTQGITCSGGRCNYAACSAGFGDCDGNPANGCEVGGTAGHTQQLNSSSSSSSRTRETRRRYRRAH
jgi:hypothetical protein